MDCGFDLVTLYLLLDIVLFLFNPEPRWHTNDLVEFHITESNQCHLPSAISRELIFGYRIKQLQSTIRSLVLLIICSLYILTTQFDFYFYIVDHEDWTLNVPLVLILSSMIGLIVHRLISLRGILDKTSTADTWNGMKS